VFEGHTGDPPVQHVGEIGRCRRGRKEHPGFVLGENAAGGAQPGDDGG
jgi:hypothetical protein